MSSIKEKKFRKLKKPHTLGSIIAFLVIACVAIASLAIMIAAFFYYVADSKLRDEYAKVENMANLYDMAEETGNADIRSLLNKEESAYIVLDASGNVIASNGENTCDDNTDRSRGPCGDIQ